MNDSKIKIIIFYISNKYLFQIKNIASTISFSVAKNMLSMFLEIISNVKSPREGFNPSQIVVGGY
jgi:hypothetical protein